MRQLPRQSASTIRENAEYRRGARKRQPVADIRHLIIQLADGTVEYLPGTRYNVLAATLRHSQEGNAIHIIRLQSQPLHLLSR